ncbi:YgzB family protein [Macrococcoides canis]|nr:YgzB family protein [Macrococcus canis]UJS28962.1 YgzB family protein [Macrococcus canis]
MRTWALSIIFIAMFVMYIGAAIFYFSHSKLLFSLFLLIGTLLFLFSFVMYFWIGMLSTRTVQVRCPNCEHYTKMLGRADICANCNQPLTLDPSLEGKEFNQDYNNKRKSKVLEEQNKNGN